mgnify:CR=1 FL=1
MNRYAVAAVLSGAFFGLTGLFTRTLTGAGLSTMGILSIRCSVAALCFFCTALGDIRQLKMHKKDFWLFAAVGILGQGMFSFCYYNAINMMSISTACILMYLSPVFVTIMAHFVFKDGISRRTVLAIILCIAGCACVSGFGGTMTYQKWPTWDEDALVKSEIEIAVQVCGKVRGRVMIPADMTKERAETELQQLPEIQKILAGKTVTKVIFVPGRLVNFIAK